MISTVLLGSLLAACGATAPAGHSAEEDDALLDPGLTFYWEGDYEGARSEWTASLEHARASLDEAGEARLLTWMGLLAMRTGEYAEARELGEAALRLKLRLGDSEGLPRAYNALGLLALAEERLPDALELFANVRTAALSARNFEAAGAAAGNLGLVRAYLGDLTGATEMLREMQEAGLRTGNRLLQANALNNLAMVAIWSGDPQAALGSVHAARTLYLELDYPLGEQHALAQRSAAAAAMGEYELALAAMDTALALARNHGLPDQEAENLMLLGGLYADLGNLRSAMRHLESAAMLSHELGLESYRGTALRRTAALHQSLGSNDRALADARAALEAHRAGGQRFEEMDDLLLLAELHHSIGRPAAGDSALAEARLAADQLDAPSIRAALALTEARIAEGAGLPGQVLQSSRRILATALEADYRPRMEAHALAARAHVALGDLELAATEGRAAVQALERVRGGITSDPLRGSFAAASAQVYGDLVLVLLQLDQTEEAFSVADAGRSRELLRRLSGAGTQRSGDPAVAEIGEAELLLRRIDALLLQVRDLESIPPLERAPGTTVAMQDVLERVQALREEYESLVSRRSAGSTQRRDLLGSAPTDAARVRHSLHPDEALLHYTITSERVVLFVLRRDAMRSVDIPIAAEDLASRIRLLRELWGTRDGDAAAGAPVAHALHRLLVGTAIRTGVLEGTERLMIVADGVLEQLPFAALQDPATGRFLVEDHSLTHVRSANLLPALRSRPTTGAMGAHRLAAFAPFPSLLPGTRAEVRSLTRGPSWRLRSGRWATERAVRRALASSGIVHVASHGVLNARNPMFSRIELARGRRSGSANDGRLEVHEVLNFSVRSSLVVLSGCETGAAEDWFGDPLRPAGITTLGQAFLQAGARNVVGTLWRIDDLGSADLMRHFYRETGDGDFSRALALAQRAMIADPAYASPYHWAGFIAMGEG